MTNLETMDKETRLIYLRRQHFLFKNFNADLANLNSKFSLPDQGQSLFISFPVLPDSASGAYKDLVKNLRLQIRRFCESIDLASPVIFLQENRE